MKNREILESLTLIHGLDFGYKWSKYLKMVDNTSIDFKYWLEKGKKFNVNNRVLLIIVLNLVEYFYENELEIKKFELCFDFMFGTFLERSDINEDINSLEDAIISMTYDYGWLEGVILYGEEFGKKIRFEDRIYLLKKSHKHIGFIDVEKNMLSRNDVLGIKLNMITGSIELIYSYGGKHEYEVINMEEKGVLKVLFYNQYGTCFL